MTLSKKHLVSILLALVTTNSYSLNESEVFNTISSYMTEGHKCQGTTQKNFWKRRVVETPFSQTDMKKKYRLRYSEYGCELAKGLQAL